MNKLIQTVKRRRSLSTKTEPNPFEESVSIRTAIATTFLEVTSIHAIPDCAQAKNSYSKIFWFILFIVCGAVGTWQVVLLINNFAARPHYIANLEIKHDETAEFPNVTICNFNRASKAQQDKFNITYQELKALWSAVNFQSLFRSDPNRNKGRDNKTLNLWNDLSKKLAEENVTNELRDIFQSLQFQSDVFSGCQTIILDCFWKGVELVDCCKKHTRLVYRQYGVCYTVILPKDGNNEAVQDSPGSRNGLILTLNPQVKDYFNITNIENMEADHDFRNGIALQIDHNEESTIMSNPVGLSPGSYNYISMKKRVEEYQPKYLFKVFEPNCTPHDDVLMFVEGQYTRSNCIMDCYQKLAHKTCNCTFLGQVKNAHLYKTCDPEDVIECLGEKTKIDPGLSSELSACSRECKISCEKRFHVDYSLSAVDFPGAYQHIIEEYFSTRIAIANSTYGLHNRFTRWLLDIDVASFIMVDIFFSDHGFLSTVHHEKEDLLELIAEIGGHFGLWLGVSVVSLIQILYYMLAWIFKIPVETSQIHNPKPVVDPVDATKAGPLGWCTPSKIIGDELFNENVGYGCSPQDNSPTPPVTPVKKTPEFIKSSSLTDIESDKPPDLTSPSVTPEQYSLETPNTSATPNLNSSNSPIIPAHPSSSIFGVQEHCGDDSFKALVLDMMKDMKMSQTILGNEIKELGIRMNRIERNSKFS